MYNSRLLKEQLSKMVQCSEDDKKKPRYERGRKFEMHQKDQRSHRSTGERGRNDRRFQGAKSQDLKGDARDNRSKPKSDKEISEEINREFAEYREAEKRLHYFWNKMTVRQQEAGLPVRTTDGRIDMDNTNYIALTNTPNAYLAREREKHRLIVNSGRERKKQDDRIWRRNTPRELWTEYRDGENLEILTLAIFLKSPLSKFCDIVPTAELDDYAKDDTDKFGKYKVGTDFILFDKQTGNLIAGFDDVSDDQGDRFKEKERRSKEVKEHGGTTLTYGLGYNKANKIIIKEVRNVPVLYLAVSSGRLRKGVKNFNPDIDAIVMSQDEKQLFVRFYKAMDEQVYQMLDEVDEKLDEKTLNSEYGRKLLIYRERLENFQRILEEPELQAFIEGCKKVAEDI